MAGKIEIMETVLRDAHQCLIATRMRTEDMLPIAAALDEVGYWSLETWGGATFDATLRFLKEDPWERLRKLRAAMPKTRFQMLLRGQNVVGYKNYPDDVVQRLRRARGGQRHRRVPYLRRHERRAQYENRRRERRSRPASWLKGRSVTPSARFIRRSTFCGSAEKLADMGVQIICLKDMAGMLAPYAAYEIIKKIKSRIRACRSTFIRTARRACRR
jgi:pyruvate/oxaloacetate carboxyltransferase